MIFEMYKTIEGIIILIMGNDKEAKIKVTEVITKHIFPKLYIPAFAFLLFFSQQPHIDRP